MPSRRSGTHVPDRSIGRQHGMRERLIVDHRCSIAATLRRIGGANSAFLSITSLKRCSRRSRKKENMLWARPFRFRPQVYSPKLGRSRYSGVDRSWRTRELPTDHVEGRPRGQRRPFPAVDRASGRSDQVGAEQTDPMAAFGRCDHAFERRTWARNSNDWPRAARLPFGRRSWKADIA